MRVMIIGASSNHSKYGNKAVRAYLRQGHDVLPVNPNEDRVEGIKTFAHVNDVPGPVDRAALYVPPEVGGQIIPSLAARGDVKELFFNPGTETPELMAEARRLGLNVTFGCAIIDIGEVPR
jgi:uncharacterized protein